MTAFPSRSRWLAAACAAPVALLFLWRVIHTPQINEALGQSTLRAAEAVARGDDRYGIVFNTHTCLDAYTDMPLGQAFILVPFLRNPSAFVIATCALALFVATWAVMLHSPVFWWPAIAVTFGSFAYQPGVVQWVGNYLESYTVTEVFCLIAVVLTAPLWAVATAGLLIGCFTYESFFANAMAVVALGIAARRRPIATTSAFVAGFACALLLHLAQVTAYRGGLAAGADDLYRILHFRLQGSWADHWHRTLPTVQLYWQTFLKPQWSNSVGLATFALVLGGHWAGSIIRRPAGNWRSLAVAACCLIAFPVWVFVTPGWALPHLHLFPRLLFGLLLIAAAGIPVSYGAVAVRQPVRQVEGALRWAARDRARSGAQL